MYICIQSCCPSQACCSVLQCVASARVELSFQSSLRILHMNLGFSSRILPFRIFARWIRAWREFTWVSLVDRVTRVSTGYSDWLYTRWGYRVAKTIGCLVFIGHFPQKSQRVSGSFTENDLQLKVSYGFSPSWSLFRPQTRVSVKFLWVSEWLMRVHVK